MRGRVRLVLALVALLPVAVASAQQGPGAPAVPDGLPGSPAPPHVVAEIQQTVDAAVTRFNAMDLSGLLALVSDQYRTGTLTKPGIADQLNGIFRIHDKVHVRVTVDLVRIVGEHAWVYSTGDVTGRLRYVGGFIPVASWQRELEVARRENGRWRLYGYQQ